MFQLNRFWVLGVAALIALSGCARTNEQAKAGQESSVEGPAIIDTKADAVLRQMSDFLAAAERFSFKVEGSMDEVLKSGQKLMLDRSGEAVLERPNRLKVRLHGDFRETSVLYDGTTLTIAEALHKVYVRTTAPDTIDQLMDFLADEHHVFVPFADLLFSLPYNSLVVPGTSGEYLGLHQVAGVRCHHLLFTNPSVDWQIWIEANGQPVPRKFVISYKQTLAHPQFIAEMSDWNFSPRLPEGTFTFEVPSGYELIRFYQPDLYGGTS